ncbi:MAG TPA: hypothetical protein VLG25_01405 [Patescibacteria group bacterium]|nr:hypothetical protein [Patescibacteria group bacterium]
MAEVINISAANSACKDCELGILEPEDRYEAIAFGREIVANPERSKIYGQAVLIATQKEIIKPYQASVLVDCIRKNLTGKCQGLKS